MVGCTLFTKPAPCVQLDMHNWLFPSFPPFVLGPFAPPFSGSDGGKRWTSSPSSAWAPNHFHFSPAATIDVELYSLVLIASDIILSVAWHCLATKVFTRPEFRVRSLSPSVRFTLGVCFGAIRLWTLSYIQPLPIHRYMSQASFLVGMVLGLTALVFNDGPWRGIRSNPTHALNPDSMLNPAHLTKVTRLSLARNTIRRSLESGKTISIVLDGEGNLLFCQSGALILRHAALFRRANQSNAIVQLMCRAEQCQTGQRFFFGFWLGEPFSHFGVGKLNASHKAFVLELMLHLNQLEHGEFRWFQLPDAVAKQLSRRRIGGSSSDNSSDAGGGEGEVSA
ncbi:hypothetical protein BASA81_003483 [Batrachochytrium salamandrivorans]|nr:hypothetical protein BASA81_003483 [Batrachochytrium salamandrivorans]